MRGYSYDLSWFTDGAAKSKFWYLFKENRGDFDDLLEKNIQPYWEEKKQGCLWKRELPKTSWWGVSHQILFTLSDERRRAHTLFIEAVGSLGGIRGDLNLSSYIFLQILRIGRVEDQALGKDLSNRWRRRKGKYWDEGFLISRSWARLVPFHSLRPLL